MPIEIDETRQRQLTDFADGLGVRFKNPALLNQALTHSSYTKLEDETALNNEKLEFLGDAVIELTTSSYLYKHFPNMSEGELTKARASLVCQESLSRIAEELGFGRMLIVGYSENNRVGRSRPSTLEDAFEAFVGALYLDRGWLAAKKFVEEKFKAGFAQVEQGHLIADCKSHLQELIQAEPGHKIEYIELKDYGPDHDKTFECAVKIDGKISGKGVGKSKKAAEQEAARMALRKLESR